MDPRVTPDLLSTNKFGKGFVKAACSVARISFINLKGVNCSSIVTIRTTL